LKETGLVVHVTIPVMVISLWSFGSVHHMQITCTLFCHASGRHRKMLDVYYYPANDLIPFVGKMLCLSMHHFAFPCAIVLAPNVHAAEYDCILVSSNANGFFRLVNIRSSAHSDW
jgi:hypothetical protein